MAGWPKCSTEAIPLPEIIETTVYRLAELSLAAMEKARAKYCEAASYFQNVLASMDGPAGAPSKKAGGDQPVPVHEASMLMKGEKAGWRSMLSPGVFSLDCLFAANTVHSWIWLSPCGTSLQ